MSSPRRLSIHAIDDRFEMSVATLYWDGFGGVFEYAGTAGACIRIHSRTRASFWPAPSPVNSCGCT